MSKPARSAAEINFAAFKKSISKSGEGPVQPDTAGGIVRTDKSKRRQYSHEVREMAREQRMFSKTHYRGMRLDMKHRPPNLRKDNDRGEARLGSGGPGRKPGDPKKHTENNKGAR